MVITQDTLIRRIADNEDIDIATVREIFNSAEDIIFDYLSSITPSEDLTIKLLNGICIERKHVLERIYDKGMFKDRCVPEHVNIKASSSRYYNRKVNESLFD